MKILISKIIFYYIRRLYMLFVSLIFFILKFFLCIFESDTVKSDCPVRIFRKMMKYFKI